MGLCAARSTAEMPSTWALLSWLSGKAVPAIEANAETSTIWQLGYTRSQFHRDIHRAVVAFAFVTFAFTFAALATFAFTFTFLVT